MAIRRAVVTTHRGSGCRQRRRLVAGRSAITFSRAVPESPAEIYTMTPGSNFSPFPPTAANHRPPRRVGHSRLAEQPAGSGARGRHHRGGNCHRGNCRDPGIRDIPCGTATSTPRGGVTVGRTLTRRRASARTAWWWDFPSDRLHLRSRHRPRGPGLRREIVLAHAHDHRSGTSPECKCSLDR